MNDASIQLTVFLFHLETCGGFVVAVASIAFLLVGFIRTRLWGFLLLAISSGGFLFQLAFRYVAFLRAYELPPALKIAATAIYFLSCCILDRNDCPRFRRAEGSEGSTFSGTANGLTKRCSRRLARLFPLLS